MCFHLKATKESQLSRAVRLGKLKWIAELKSKILPETDLPLFHASGFSHPKLVIYTDTGNNPFEVASWGLIPEWISDSVAAKKIRKSTLNARSETIFEKPSFKDAVLNKRCIVYLDGFYEYQHRNKIKYPYFIQDKNKKPLAIAGLWSTWYDAKENKKICSFTIITCLGNAFMAKIHNNPKLKEPRMPLFIDESQEELWLNSNLEINEKTIQELTNKALKIDLQAHTVNALQGANYLGNVENISDEFIPKELKNKLTLF